MARCWAHWVTTVPRQIVTIHLAIGITAGSRKAAREARTERRPPVSGKTRRLPGETRKRCCTIGRSMDPGATVTARFSTVIRDNTTDGLGSTTTKDTAETGAITVRTTGITIA